MSDEKRNNRSFINHIQSVLSDKLSKNLYEKPTEDTTNQIDYQVSDFLQDLKERKSINDFNVDSQLEYCGWKDIHGSRIKGVYAWFCSKIVKLLKLPCRSKEFKWYHGLLMYKSKQPDFEHIFDIMFDEIGERDITMSEVQNWILDNSDLFKTYYDFQFPEYFANVDLTIQPVKSVEYIQMDVVLNDE